MSKKQTPMMEQYLDIKSRYSEELLFFRLGDFYELFNEDALVASRELNITLTGRPTGDEERTPMCGVPFHAAESYIETLVKKGYKVAICEQLEDPKAVKGIVKRDVIKVVTPGTVMTENGNDARSNNFFIIILYGKDTWILVFSDVSTGEVIWHRITDCENAVICTMHSACIDQVKSYCLKERYYRKIFRILLKINLVMSYFLLFLHTIHNVK